MGMMAIKAAAQVENPSADSLKSLREFAAGMQLVAQTDWKTLAQQAADAFKPVQAESDARDALVAQVTQAQTQLTTAQQQGAALKAEAENAKAQADKDIKAAKAAHDAEVANVLAVLKRREDAVQQRENAASQREVNALASESANTIRSNQLDNREAEIEREKQLAISMKQEAATRLAEVAAREQHLLNG